VGVNQLAFAPTVDKKNRFPILGLEIWEMEKFAINHGVKIADDSMIIAFSHTPSNPPYTLENRQRV
jgi:hypothetical protein